MARSKCPACGRDFIKGRIALVQTTEGLKGKKVCQRCFDGGATIVHLSAPSRVVTCSEAGCKHEASVCAKCLLRSQRDVLGPFIANLESKLKAKQRFQSEPGYTDDPFFTGQVQVYEDVIALLKSGRA